MHLGPQYWLYGRIPLDGLTHAFFLARAMWDQRLFFAMLVMGVMSLILAWNVEGVYPSLTYLVRFV